MSIITIIEKHILILANTEHSKPDIEKDMYKRLNDKVLSKAFDMHRRYNLQLGPIKRRSEIHSTPLFKYKVLIVEVELYE